MILPMEPVQHVQLTVRHPVQYAQEGAADIAHTPGIAVALARIRAVWDNDADAEYDRLKLRVNAQGA
jgi:hypothetical protein